MRAISDEEIPYGLEHKKYVEPSKPKPTLNQERWKQMIRRALLKKQRAGLGDFKAPQKKMSKREKTREFWRTHPEVEPWNMKNGKMSPHWKGQLNEERSSKNQGQPQQGTESR